MMRGDERANCDEQQADREAWLSAARDLRRRAASRDGRLVSVALNGVADAIADQPTPEDPAAA